MTANIINSMSEEYSITPKLAKEITLHYSDQPVPPPPTGTAPPPSQQQRPPAREVDPFWKFSTFWQIAEPTVAWPLGVYNMAKLGMAAQAGLPARAGLPRALGGMTARELWASVKQPDMASRFHTYMTTPKAQRGVRPKISSAFTRPTRVPTGTRPTTRPRTPAGGRLGGIPPNMLAVSSWMVAAGILSTALGGPAEEAAAKLGIGQPPL